MTDQRHNAAFVVGSILGGVAGAAAALWKTPQSGPELRAKLAGRLGVGGGTGRAVSSDAPDTVHVAKASTPSRPSKPSKVWDIWSARTSPETRTSGGSSGVGGKVLSVVEKATAPIVGVKLGETAREAGSRALSGAVSTVRPGSRPDAGTSSASTDTPVTPAAASPVTPPEEPPTVPAFESSGEITGAGVGHVASTEELVTPAVPVETQSTEKATGPLTDFPAFDADDRDRTT